MGHQIKCPTRKTLVLKIEELYNNMIVAIMKDVQENSYFCTTADIWSAHISYMGVTLHFFNNSYERISYAIACVRFEGIHDYENIGRILENIFQKYGLNNKNNVICVTDNGSNFIKSFKEYGLEFFFESDENSESEEVEFQSIDDMFETDDIIAA